MVRPVPFLRRVLQRFTHGVLVLCGAVLATLLAFLVLPLMATIGKPNLPDLTVQNVDTAVVPPPPPPPEPEPDKPKDEEPPPPQLQEPAQPLDLSQLELVLNPGLGGDFGGGDFAIGKIAAAATSDEGDQGLFSLADLDQKPRAIHQPSPQLTPELRRRTPATVHVLFLVGPDGRVESPIVQKATDPAFEAAALAAIKQWKFEPGKRNGQPVRFRMRVPITFPAG